MNAVAFASSSAVNMPFRMMSLVTDARSRRTAVSQCFCRAVASMRTIMVVERSPSHMRSSTDLATSTAAGVGSWLKRSRMTGTHAFFMARDVMLLRKSSAATVRHEST